MEPERTSVELALETAGSIAFQLCSQRVGSSVEHLGNMFIRLVLSPGQALRPSSADQVTELMFASLGTWRDTAEVTQNYTF